ncbi:unnamed protein product [Ceutorhynchus assimilis]|uniref:Uncharacterized protein n=1 Tax=Ceutorhynchus assimilis TaxID=467358 RepID=A0A9N9QKD4_9CUCU|nr:unnamed protein product [Ceutorhynchus assimilis]
MDQFPSLKEHKCGREYILIPNESNVLNNISESDSEGDALGFNRFINNVRSSVFSSNVAFRGEFEENCEEKAIPSSLLATINMLLYGSAVHTECRASKPGVTICQLIMFNMLQALPKGNIIRHKKKLEPPLPIYLGLSIYARSRNKQQIDELHNLGISISSNRVMEITAQFSHVVVGRAEEEGVVCPSSLKKGLFTVAAIDNIDHNPSGTTSAGSFHGTGISVFQLPLKEEEATIRNFQISFEDLANNLRSVPNLPDSFAVVPDYIFHNKQPAPSSCSEDIAQRMRASVNVMSMWHLGSDWLSHIHVQMNELCEKMPQNISWSSFRSNEVKYNVTILKSISTLLPLFYEKSTSPAMIRHALRLGNFTEYTESLLRMIPWFFAFSHSNYARWISVHVKDLLELETKLPNVYREFMLGNFVVHKSGCIFSAVGIDQAHEQNNALIKADGGAVGLLHDATALKRWMIAGPEISGLLSQFQENIAGVDKKGTHHHEQYSAFQKSFYEKCLALKESFIQAENPFKIRSEDLIALDTRMVADEEGVAALHGAETIGNDLFHEFIDRLVLAPTSLYSPIKKSNVKIFCFKKKKLVRVAPNQQLKSDAQLFSRLFIVSSSRRLDLDKFFEHENQSFPPAISVSGELRTGSKSTLVSILENLCREIQQPQPTSCDAVVYDGAALVHFLKPSRTIKLFSEYRAQVKSHIEVFCKNLKAERVDIAWDLYRDDSIKTTARQSRGTGARRQDLPNKGELPKKWDEYLKNSSNKVELFEYLAKGCLAEIEELNVVTNVGVTLRASVPASSSLNEALCDQIEEADGRVILHLADMMLTEDPGPADSHEAMNNRDFKSHLRKKRSFEFLVGLVNNNSKYEVIRSDPAMTSPKINKVGSLDQDLISSDNILRHQKQLEEEYLETNMKRKIENNISNHYKFDSTTIKWPTFDDIENVGSAASTQIAFLKKGGKNSENRNSQKNFAYHKVTGKPAHLKKNPTAYIAVSAISPKPSEPGEDLILETELHQLKPWKNKVTTKKV